MQPPGRRPMRSVRLITRASSQTSRLPLPRHFTGGSNRRRVFEDGDVVLLREKRLASHEGILVKLKEAKRTATHRGNIQHSDVIGKSLRQIVSTSKGVDYRIHEPTLAEYVRLTPRIVTPIYPSDANLIVSLLDLHVDTPPMIPDDAPPLEILEAGTGHGALTLHLSRAIHAANPSLPAVLPVASSQEPEDAVYLGESVSDLQESNLESWKRSRRAVVHTLDISSKHMKHARKIVQGFRNGVYARNVDFHVGDVSEWIASQRVSRESEDPFLSYVLLDLPNATDHLANVAPALHVDGVLTVFNPSITQVVECNEVIREKKLPYLLDQVVELGTGTVRQWDVRSVRPRSMPRKPEGSRRESDDSGPESAAPDESLTDAVKDQASRDAEQANALAEDEGKRVTVCRPKVGELVVGGGFLGVWRRMEGGWKCLMRDHSE